MTVAAGRAIKFQKVVTMLSALVIFIILLLTAHASADVIAFDDVVNVRNTARLRVLTKGTFFPEGGRLVSLSVDGRHIGTVLSGGDGFAFLSFSPPDTGLKKIKAISGDESGEAVLLVTGKKDRVVLLAIDDFLMQSLLAKRDHSSIRDGISAVVKNFRLIYVVKIIGSNQAHAWIRKGGYPESAVITWEGESTVGELLEKKIPLYAIIAPADILSQAGSIDKKFSFDETEEGTQVSDWNELLKKLQNHEKGR